MSTTGMLEMDSQDLAALASEIGGNAQALAGLNNQFKTAYETITSAESWIGDDANNFASVASNLYTDLDKARQMLEEVSSNLQTTATTYDETAAGVNSTITSMLG